MVHTVKGFGTVNKVEVDVFLELSCFLNDPKDVGNLISGSSVNLKNKTSNKYDKIETDSQIERTRRFQRGAGEEWAEQVKELRGTN